MLIELLERWRGVDRWPETTATVYSVNRYNGGDAGDLADVTFRYQDGQGGYQAGCYTVNSYTSLYNIEKDDTFSLRYNPAKPKQYFSGEYETTANDRLRSGLISSAVLLFFLVYLILLAIKWLSQR
jgi:hypothetical protein